MNCEMVDMMMGMMLQIYDSAVRLITDSTVRHTKLRPVSYKCFMFK